MEVEGDRIIASSLAIELYPHNSKEYLVSRVYIVIPYFGYNSICILKKCKWGRDPHLAYIENELYQI